jgi:hypothetical protein
MIALGNRLNKAIDEAETLGGSLAIGLAAVAYFIAAVVITSIFNLIDLYRHTARQLDAARGPGTARIEAIGMVITLSLAAIAAVGVAAITGGA